jgi:hypothetical protein
MNHGLDLSKIGQLIITSLTRQNVSKTRHLSALLSDAFDKAASGDSLLMTYSMIPMTIRCFLNANCHMVGRLTQTADPRLPNDLISREIRDIKTELK